MAKKKKKKKTKVDAIRDDVAKTAKQVWLAGLGALSLAEKEGTRLFSSLVEQGEDFEKKSRPRVKELKAAAAQAGGKARERLEKVGESLGESAEKVGEIVDETVTSALHKFGIPTKREIDDLAASVAALSEQLKQAKGKRKKTTRKKATRKKTARKKTAKRAAKKATRKRTRRAAKKATRKKTARKSGGRATHKKTTRKKTARKRSSRRMG